jgi:integrase
LGPEEIRAFQLHLITERHLAPSTLIVAVAALRFLYTVTLKQPWPVDVGVPAPTITRPLPVVLSPGEVVHFLACIPGLKHRAILTTCYAAGLRIAEAVRLTIPAIDGQRMVLRVAQGKGRKDRYVMLSPRLLDRLRDWWRVSRSPPGCSPAIVPTAR